MVGVADQRSVKSAVIIGEKRERENTEKEIAETQKRGEKRRNRRRGDTHWKDRWGVARRRRETHQSAISLCVGAALVLNAVTRRGREGDAPRLEVGARVSRSLCAAVQHGVASFAQLLAALLALDGSGALVALLAARRSGLVADLVSRVLLSLG